MTLEMKYDELREEALAEGLKRGLTEGLEQGKKETYYDTARKMKQDNFSFEVISKYTNLSKEEILML